MADLEWTSILNNDSTTYRWRANIDNIKRAASIYVSANILSAYYAKQPVANLAESKQGIGAGTSLYQLYCYDASFNTNDVNDWMNHISGREVIYQLETPTTETIQVPDIEVSPTDTYTCEISQGAKAVSWSSFETELN